MRLDIVVACDCAGCEQAQAIAGELQGLFPELDVNIIELDGRHTVPDGVVATPTYLLDGAIISLGNPKRETLFRKIALRSHALPAQVE